MTEMLRPMLELAVLIPGTLLAYLPMKEHLKIKMGALTAIWLSTLLMLCIVGGLFCYSFEIKTISLILPAFMLMSVAYCATLRTSILKSANIALAVCGVYACGDVPVSGRRPAASYAKRPASTGPAGRRASGGCAVV